MTSTQINTALAALFWAVSAAALHASCYATSFEDVPMTVCSADPASDDLRLWLNRPDGQVYGTFERIRTDLAEEGKDLGFAMNGGMYHDDRSAVGHYIDGAGEAQRLITAPGPGNFGFCQTAYSASERTRHRSLRRKPMRRRGLRAAMPRNRDRCW